MSYLNKISEFKKFILFGIEQLVIYLEAKKDDYEKNQEIKDKLERVYKENLVVLEEELIYISRTVDIIKDFNESNFNSCEEYKEALLNKIKEYYKTNGVPMVCYVIISEKIDSCFNFFKSLYE